MSSSLQPWQPPAPAQTFETGVEERGETLRCTIAGSARQVDVVLDTSGTPAEVVPELLDLLGEPRGRGPWALHTAAGRRVDLDAPWAHTPLGDGVVLHLAPEAVAPPPPTVLDMVEATAGVDLPGLWSPHGRRVVAGVCAGLFFVFGTVLVAEAVPVGHTGTAYAIGALVALIGAVVGALVPQRPLGWAMVVVTVVLTCLGLSRSGVAAGSGVAIAVVVAGLLLVAGGLLTRRLRAWATGAWVWFTLALLWWGLLLVVPPAMAASAVMVVSVVVLGLLPRLSLIVAGVHSAADEVAHGRRIPTGKVDDAVVNAHQTLAVTTAVVAASFAVGAWFAVTETRRPIWALTLTIVAVVGWLLRSRALPLVQERLATGLAGAIGTVALSFTLVTDPTSAMIMGGALLLVAVVIVALAESELSAPVAAQARRWGDRLELVAMIALIPLTAGQFGVYDVLLGAGR